MRAFLPVSVTIFVACAAASPPPTQSDRDGPGHVSRAKVTLHGLGKTGKARGAVFISALGAGIKVQGTIYGLPPGSTHGVHVHEATACAAVGDDGDFNPTNNSHGGPADATAHLGDLGNVTADASGQAIISVIRPGARLDQGPNGILGHVLILHEHADDLKTQPDGAVGAAVACGMIAPE